MRALESSASGEAEAALQTACEENAELAGCWTAADRERLVRYWALLTRWGATLNLSRRRDALEWARFDVADSFLGLHAAGAGSGALGSLDSPSSPGAMDVGSGAGFPGVALALRSAPDTSVRWVETVQRRTSFLHRVTRELGLAHVQVCHQRVEEVREAAALVTVRATFPWQELGILRGAVAPGGRLVAFLGREPGEQAWCTQVESWGWVPRWYPYRVAGLGPRAMGVAQRPTSDRPLAEE